MKITGLYSLGAIFVVLCLGLSSFCLFAETIYIDSRSGSDSNPGTKEKPLQTIAKAVELVNSSKETGPTTIKIAPGVYNLTKAVLFKNDRAYTEKNRLAIEAEILPDDPNWLPKFMPIVISTEPPPKSVYEKYKHSVENITNGFKIEVNHATIQGLKFLGNPAEKTWHRPILRRGDNLTDLLVTQCMFVGDKRNICYLPPICIVAKGEKIVVEHCIFYNCRVPFVFWDAEDGSSNGCAVRYCIIDGASAAIWTTQTAEDLEFHHNIITRSNYIWMRDRKNRTKYRLQDCVITDCKYYSGYGDAYELYGQTGSEISFIENNITKQGNVCLQEDIEEFDIGVILAEDKPREYLHPLPGTVGSELGAGLFKKQSVSKTEEEQSFIKKTYTYKKVDGLEIFADVFIPAKYETHAVVLYIHGGYFMFGSRTGRPRKPLLDKLIEANYAVVSIDYRLAPATKLEELIKDVRDASIWIRNEGPALFNADPNKLGIVGGSAGAFLATACGYMVEPGPQAVVAVSGYADFEFAKQSTDRSILKQNNLYDSVGKKVVTQGGQDRYKLCFYLVDNGLWPWEVLGFEPKSNPEKVNELLPINHISSDYPATLFIHSRNDPYIPLSQVERLSRTLTEKKVESELFVVPQGHSSEIIRNDPEAVDKIVSFLDKYLK